jgi:hypothetical protein
MSAPWDVLATALAAANDGVNIYPTPDDNVTPPAIVIRPDTPWIEPGDFSIDDERYAAIALVTASTPEDGLAALHTLVHSIAHEARAEGWEFVSVSAPAIDESTGTPFLAATVSLIYRNCEHPEDES